MSAEKEFLSAYDKYADAIYRHCYFRVYNKELAEDLAQETFIKTWKYIIAGQEIKNIKSFLYKVAVNLVIDHSRKKKELYIEDIEKKEQGSGMRLYNIEAGLFDKFEAGELRKMLNLLSEKQKEVITMRYVDELLPGEIAEILGETPNAISVRLNQGMKKFKEIIKENYQKDVRFN